MNRFRYLLALLLCISPIAHAGDETADATSRISALFACQMFFSSSYQATSDPDQKEKLGRISKAFLIMGIEEATAADPNKDPGNVQFSFQLKSHGERDFKAFMTKVDSLPQADRHVEYGKFVRQCADISGLARR